MHISSSSSRLIQTIDETSDISNLRFVSGKRKTAFQKLRMNEIRDLFWHVPYRYIDFSVKTPIASTPLGEKSTVIGVVDKVELKNIRPGLSVLVVYIVDESGVMQLSFFNQPWLEASFKPGSYVCASGKVEFNYGFRQMASPDYEFVVQEDMQSAGKLKPAHKLTEGLSANWLRRIVINALADAGHVLDYLPADLRDRHSLMSKDNAYRTIHYPASLYERELARRRLAFDEVFLLQVALFTRQYMSQKHLKPFVHTVKGPAYQKLQAALPFTLTDEQQQAVDEILTDMSSDSIMNRLLLGDVGTGKTVVAALAMAACKDSGSQACLMAPTSVLATQHAEKLIPLFKEVGITCKLLIGSMSLKQRSEIYRQLEEGSVDVVIGTSALLNKDLNYKNLSLVIIDEQHRFGVNQRARLRQKGIAPDLLSMTATPIPRTLALSIYGDMMLSVIKHRPIQKEPTLTKVVTPSTEDEVYQTIEHALDKGNQAYIVCSKIDDNDEGQDDMDGFVVDDEMSDKRRLYATVGLQLKYQQVFPDRRVGLLHGRMTSEEKDVIMQDFHDKKLDILVSTTVIEVGVDVPNATVIAIYDADRFGLATLHQLRGRVGRGKDAGTCLLMSPVKKGSKTRKRLEALAHCNDGFELAEEDLKLRHEGEILGYRQHGGVVFNLVDVEEDQDLIEAAHTEVLSIMNVDPELQKPEHKPLALEVQAHMKIYFEEVGNA